MNKKLFVQLVFPENHFYGLKFSQESLKSWTIHMLHNIYFVLCTRVKDCSQKSFNFENDICFLTSESGCRCHHQSKENVNFFVFFKKCQNFFTWTHLKDGNWTFTKLYQQSSLYNQTFSKECLFHSKNCARCRYQTKAEKNALNLAPTERPKGCQKTENP